MYCCRRQAWGPQTEHQRECVNSKTQLYCLNTGQQHNLENTLGRTDRRKTNDDNMTTSKGSTGLKYTRGLMSGGRSGEQTHLTKKVDIQRGSEINRDDRHQKHKSLGRWKQKNQEQKQISKRWPSAQDHDRDIKASKQSHKEKWSILTEAQNSHRRKVITKRHKRTTDLK